MKFVEGLTIGLGLVAGVRSVSGRSPDSGWIGKNLDKTAENSQFIGNNYEQDPKNTALFLPKPDGVVSNSSENLVFCIDSKGKINNVALYIDPKAENNKNESKEQRAKEVVEPFLEEATGFNIGPKISEMIYEKTRDCSENRRNGNDTGSLR